MTGLGSAAPLLALDAIALDLETTGLNAADARIVEIGAVRIGPWPKSAAAPFWNRLNPGEPIPASATAIHGIDDVAIAAAPPFKSIWPPLVDYVGDAVVVGHSLGFDLAVLRRECDRAGLTWKQWRVLDIRLLAELAEPNLAGYSLDQLAAWLGIVPGEKHSALGDAATAARIFASLVPRLREKDIRTLAEAELACRALTPILDQHHEAGWIDVTMTPGVTDNIGRIDSYPFRRRVREIMTAPAKFTPGDTPVEVALNRMAREEVSSLFVAADANATAHESGIVTERDVMRALAAQGSDALKAPISQLMSRPLASVAADAFVYHAIARMRRLKYRHLGVVDDAGRVVGAVSARDLLRLRAEESIALDDEIAEAEDVAGLARAWARLPQVAAALLRERLSGIEVTAVVSRELGRLTQHAAILAERRLHEEGYGNPPCAYAVAVLGSAGREESMLAFDQDNALIFAEDDRDGIADRYFAVLGGHIADILHEAGVPYCKGGVMASNAHWRGSSTAWRVRVADWIQRTTPAALLSVDIFFDLRFVHGDRSLTSKLENEAFDAARGNVAFAKGLAEAAGSITGGLGLFGRFKTEQGRIDLKRSGLFGIVTFARALTVCHHVVARSTPTRLMGLKALDLGAEADFDALAEAHATFVRLVLNQQIEDIEAGIRPTNAVRVQRLSRSDKGALRRALEAVQHLDDLTRELLFRG